MKTIYKAVLFGVIACAMLYAGAVFAQQTPVANAGPDFYVSSGQTVTLLGSGYDTNGGIATYRWQCDGGTLSNYTIPQPVYTAPYINGYYPYETYTCTLVVQNNTGFTNSDSAKIYVNYNDNADIISFDTQTNAASNVYSNQATISGSFTSNNNNANYAWFEYGFSPNYGTETAKQNVAGSSGSFSQDLSGLYLNATYHYRAVVQDYLGNKFYGQDMIFSTGQTSLVSNGYLSVSEKVMNLTRGDWVWQTSVDASPSDILAFSITLEANSRDVHNINIRSILPSKLIYKGSLAVNGAPSNENIASGVNIGAISSGQTVAVVYQAQVAPNSNGSVLASNTVVNANEAGAQNTSATVEVNMPSVLGASIISTGITNSFLTDSFLLPLLVIMVGLWLYFSGEIYVVADKIKSLVRK